MDPKFHAWACCLTWTLHSPCSCREGSARLAGSQCFRKKNVVLLPCTADSHVVFLDFKLWLLAPRLPPTMLNICLSSFSEPLPLSQTSAACLLSLCVSVWLFPPTAPLLLHLSQMQSLVSSLSMLWERFTLPSTDLLFLFPYTLQTICQQWFFMLYSVVDEKDK